jgi:hypothetical protein
MAWIMKDQSDQSIGADIKIIPLKSVSNDCFTVCFIAVDIMLTIFLKLKFLDCDAVELLSLFLTTRSLR